MTKYTNRLSTETSPYLLQHAHNPVNWFPWGAEALEKAKNEDKPILVSIGYSACHWCHVMERESFENETLAALMNRDFICIKIDREERPDIDQIYMDAVQAMGLNGGWPLNVFLTPEQRPFYGGTYFPPQAWGQILRNVAKAFYGKREQLEESAKNFTTAISQSEISKFRLFGEQSEFTAAQLNNMFNVLESRFDRQLGGIKKEPKFPMPSIWRFLLVFYHETESPNAREQLLLTLDAIAKGGIYDQVGGGFSRYSVDAEWFAPHFEKMLYDNGQLLSLYAEAYMITKKPLYKEVLLQTIEWLDREMKSHENAFFAALDADSEGVEGKFYTWTYAELQSLTPNLEHIAKYYHAKPEGNWEDGRNILYWTDTDGDFAQNNGIKTEDWLVIKSNFIASALKARHQRIRPGLDNKILAGWNGLALKGLIDAYHATKAEHIRALAIDNATFITSKMVIDGTLYRSYTGGTRKIEGYLEDYAFVIDALLAVYEITFDEKWLTTCKTLTDKVMDEFYDREEQFFFFTSQASENLIARKKEIFDNVIPSSNAAMAHVLHKMGKLLDNNQYTEIGDTMMRRMASLIVKEPQYLSHWAILYANYCKPSAEIAIVGPDAIQMAEEMSSHYIPNKVICGTTSTSNLPLLTNRSAINGKTTIYVCFEKSCKLPVHTVQEALAQIP